MANLNLKRVAPTEARRIRLAAKARGETMKQFLVAAGRLRADLDLGVGHIMADAGNLPICPVRVAVLAGRMAKEAMDTHRRDCPICTGNEVQARVGPQAAPGWAELAREVGWGADLQKRVAALPEREREVVTDLYGLDGRRRATLADIGRGMGLSRERVRQIADRAKAALRG